MQTSDRLDRLTVTASSPGGSVRVVLGAADGPDVRVRSNPALPRAEPDLAAEIAATLNSALAARRRANLMAIDSPGEPPPPTPALERRARFERLIDAVAFTTVSAEGDVKIGWSGAEGISVGIRPGTLRVLNGRELSRQVTRTAARALASFAERVGAAHRKVYGAPFQRTKD
ncbi:YbaB/EbfC family nucleoid-associated protein [Phytomonospora sp. NPDC050363]|uniref:YbaB/EbfC family nucleoid-associated protein n=1 Tax=Phytomonospora sp. NPDC050363 TaxID=3155642 RepID=UPI0033E0258D